MSHTRTKQDPPQKRCKYCRAKFTPRAQGSEQLFCSANHRKNYHKYGTLPFDRLMDRVRKELARMVADHITASEELLYERLEKRYPQLRPDSQ